MTDKTTVDAREKRDAVARRFGDVAFKDVLLALLENYTMKDSARLLGVTHNTLCAWLRDYEIEWRAAQVTILRDARTGEALRSDPAVQRRVLRLVSDGHDDQE